MSEKNSFRIYLRAFEPEDYLETVKWHNDPEIWSTVVSNRRYVSKEYEKKWVNDKIFCPNDCLHLGVCFKENDLLIGQAILNDIEITNGSAEFAIMIGNKKYWGKGLAQEATMLMLYHGFFCLGLERIQAKQLVTNEASIHVHQKCGFTNEGVLRKAFKKNGEWVDLNLMSILKEDFVKIMENNHLSYIDFWSC